MWGSKGKKCKQFENVVVTGNKGMVLRRGWRSLQIKGGDGIKRTNYYLEVGKGKEGMGRDFGLFSPNKQLALC